MIQHYFFVPVDVSSPRWRTAFDSLEVVGAFDQLPAHLGATIVWCHERILEPKQVLELLGRDAKVVVLVDAEQPAGAKYWLEHGAVGYIHFGAAVEVLQSVAQVVTHSGIWMGAELLRAIVQSTHQQISQATTEQLSAEQLASLSSRECEVARLVTRGLSNKEIARHMALSERTVKAHLTSVFQKLAVRDRLHLALVFPK